MSSHRVGQRSSHVLRVGWGGRKEDTLMSEGPCLGDPSSDPDQPEQDPCSQAISLVCGVDT